MVMDERDVWRQNGMEELLCAVQVFAAVWMAGALTERNVPDKICKFGISVFRIAKRQVKY